MASVHTPVRQPFGVLDSSKLRNLQSIKNRQNAITPSSAPSLKRRHVTLDLSDSENVDPIDHKASLSKRKRTDNEDDLCKPSSYILKPYAKPKPRLSTPSISTPRPQTPSLSTTVKPSITSASAPAGRSPVKSKRSGILSNRRSRLNAPTFGVRSYTPLSLAAALNGTLASKKQKQRIDATTLEDSKPKSWFFDIYEETEEQQNYTVNEWTMTQSANTLDISDDETKATTKDDRGKENIPPSDIPSTNAIVAQTSTATSRKDMMTDEPRTPLGDLNPSEYYAEGCDASSVILVAVDEHEHNSSDLPKKSTSSLPLSNTIDEVLTADFDFHAPSPADKEENSGLMTQSELSNLLLGAAPAPDHITVPEQLNAEAGLFANHHHHHGGADRAESADIEIWESGSAKDEAAEADMDREHESIFAEL